MDIVKLVLKWSGAGLMVLAVLANPWGVNYFFNLNNNFDFSILLFNFTFFILGLITYKFSQTKPKELILLYVVTFFCIIFLKSVVNLITPKAPLLTFFYDHDDELLWTFNSLPQNFNISEDNLVYFVGDSFVFAGLTDYQNIFATLIDEQILEYNFINLGVPGYDIYQYNILLRRYAAIKKPEAVVLNLFLGNDLRTDERLRQYIMIFFEGAGFLPKKKEFDFFVIKQNWDGEKFSPSYYPGVVGKEAQFSRINYRGRTQSLVTDSLAELQKIIDFTNDNDINLIVVIHPSNYQIYPEIFDLYLDKFNESKSDFDTLKPQKIVKDFLDSNNTPHIDLLPAFIEAGGIIQFYREYDIHYNEAGHMLAAEVVAAKLKEVHFLDNLENGHEK